MELLIAHNLAGTEIPEDIGAEIENFEAIDAKEKQSVFWITYELLGEDRQRHEF